MIYFIIVILGYFAYCWWTKNETEEALYEEYYKKYEEVQRW